MAEGTGKLHQVAMQLSNTRRDPMIAFSLLAPSLLISFSQIARTDLDSRIYCQIY
jgi:hypothetical protein